MKTSREYLIELGLAKPGPGRLSREAKAALDKALQEGMEFSDRRVDGSRKPAERTIRKARVITPTADEDVSLYRPEPKPKVSQIVASAPVERVQREDGISVVYGIDKPTRPGGRPLAIAVLYCYGCGLPVIYCQHEFPKLPKWLTGVDGMPALLKKPTAKELANAA